MVLAALWWFGVATKVLGCDRGVYVGGVEAGRDIDLRSRPGLLKLGVTTWALGSDGGRRSCARDLLAVRVAAPTTWALRAQCPCDLGSGCAHCAPNLVLIQCIVYSHCLDHCSWTLFMKTVHMVKKKYKNFKNFLVCDLICGIFILQLLQMQLRGV